MEVTNDRACYALALRFVPAATVIAIRTQCWCARLPVLLPLRQVQRRSRATALVGLTDAATALLCD
jgi:hypothetical protein